jgi:hypothetical protein
MSINDLARSLQCDLGIMSITSIIDHVVVVAITSFSIAACGDDGPCLDGGDDGECVVGEAGETGEGEGGNPHCAPHEDFTSGASLICQGAGTGWLVTDVYGAGNANPITTCLAYDETQDVPKNPTSADCASIPLNRIPYEIPAPAACCTDKALPHEIEDTCMKDCGYAACKTAIAAIRAAADVLTPPNGVPQGVIDTSKADLYAYADVLEAPAALNECADRVRLSPGQVVSLGLNSGVSKPTALGHIKNATLFLGCGLDPDEPYIPDPDAPECTEATNFTAALTESESEGPITGGAIGFTGPGVDAFAPILTASVSTRETLNDDMSIDFTLTNFNATVRDVTVGSFEFRNAQIHLVTPATGSLDAETATFAPGTLRFEISATLIINGIPLFDGRPMTAEYANSSTTTAIRSLEGSFHFVDATFTMGEYAAVLHTEPTVLHRIE